MRAALKPKDRHHRKPRSIGGTDDPENISIVPRNKHEAWHLLFSNFEPELIVEIINKFWIDPEYALTAVKRRRR